MTDESKNFKGYEFGKLKQKPEISRAIVEQTINENAIYSEAMKHYRKQIAYGIEKYPEPLNMDTWTLVETLEHEISELIDQLNYKVMLKLKLIDEMGK